MLRALALGGVLGLSLAATACDRDDGAPDSGPPDPCATGDTFIGDPSRDPEIEVGEISYDGTFRTIEAGATLSLFTPPQGGKIVLVGARVRNMDGCGAVLTARLRDPTAEGEPVAVHEGRTVRFVELPDRPGWGEVPTGPSAFTVLAAGSNLPTCHNYEDRDMDGCDWILDVTVDDRAQRAARATFPVSITCPDDDPGAEREDERLECECECAARFDERDCEDLASWQDVPAECTPAR